MGKTDRLMAKLDELKYAIRNREFTVVSDACVKHLKDMANGRYKRKIDDLVSFYQIQNYDVFVSKLDSLIQYLSEVRR